MSDFSTLINNWFFGMVIVMNIYHISGYFFTKDKSFFFYALHLTSILYFFFRLGNDATSLPIEENLILFHDSKLWVSLIWFWMTFGRFFIAYMNVKKSLPTLYKESMLYIWFTTIFFTLLFLIDLYFFKQKYFTFYAYALLFIAISLAFVVRILFLLSTIKDKLKVFFNIGFLSFLAVSFYFYFSVLLNLKTLNDFIHPITVLQLGILLQILIISVGLGYKYQLLKIRKNELNKKIIVQLQKNKELKNISNKRLKKTIQKETKRLEETIQRAEKFKRAQIEEQFQNEINKLQVNSLLSYMNPHFIFNALNSIKLYIINNEQRKAAYYLTKFSKFIREILNASNQTETTLLEEFKTMRLYTSIENIRFEEKIKFELINLDYTDLASIKVMPLFLHPFLENAIWAGVASKEDHNKLICVSVKSAENHIVITIQDNGVGRKKAVEILQKKKIKNTNLALNIKNIKNRFSVFYKNCIHNYEINTTDLFDENNIPSGTLVTLKLPMA